MKILNTRFWLLATGTLFTVFSNYQRAVRTDSSQRP